MQSSFSNFSIKLHAKFLFKLFYQITCKAAFSLFFSQTTNQAIFQTFEKNLTVFNQLLFWHIKFDVFSRLYGKTSWKRLLEVLDLFKVRNLDKMKTFILYCIATSRQILLVRKYILFFAYCGFQICLMDLHIFYQSWPRDWSLSHRRYLYVNG